MRRAREEDERHDRGQEKETFHRGTLLPREKIGSRRPGRRYFTTIRAVPPSVTVNGTGAEPGQDSVPDTGGKFVRWENEE